MATLASFTAQTDSESTAIVVPADGAVQILVRGNLGATGRVYALLKGDDAAFHHYPELTWVTHRGAREVNLLANDEIKIKVEGCTAADIEVRQ